MQGAFVSVLCMFLHVLYVQDQEFLDRNDSKKISEEAHKHL